MLTAAQKGSIPPTPSIHRLRRGLPGYLILFAPHAFEPQRHCQSSKPPSPPVFLLISTHFTATLGIPLTSPALKTGSYSRRRSSLTTEFYEPKPFFTHAALLRQTFVHCGRFPTAASRRSLGRVSVPVWPITLSGRLRIVALVGRYPTNQLMRRRPIHQ